MSRFGVLKSYMIFLFDDGVSQISINIFVRLDFYLL